MNSIFGSFDDLYLFCKVVEAGSLQKAAVLVGVPVSTMSRRLNILEKRLGVRLLERKGRQLSATETGEVFFQSLNQELALNEEKLLQILSAEQETKGNIRLILPYTIYQNTVGVIVENFLKEFPAVSIEIILKLDESVPVTDRDLVIGFDRNKYSDFIARPYFSSRDGLYASPEYLAKQNGQVTFDNLSQHDWVMVDGSRPLQLKTPEGNEVTLRLTPRVIVNDLTMLMRTVEAGLGIAAIPRHYVDSQKSGLIELLPEYHLQIRQAYIYYKRRNYQPKALSLLVERLLQHSPQ